MNSNSDNLIFFGIQGSGKGTQAQIIAKKWNLKIFETGGELRKIMNEQSELGKTVREIIQRGDLVPNEIVMEIVAHFLENTDESERILFDGLPRSMPQKETFDALLEKYGREVTGVFLDVPRNEVIVRMKNRGREDDTDEVIERRLKNYEEETLPVIKEYEKEGKMIRVNGSQPIDKVSAEIVEKLER